MFPVRDQEEEVPAWGKELMNKLGQIRSLVVSNGARQTKKVPEVMKNIQCMPTTEQGMLLGRSATFVASSDI